MPRIEEATLNVNILYVPCDIFFPSFMYVKQ